MLVLYFSIKKIYNSKCKNTFDTTLIVEIIKNKFTVKCGMHFVKELIHLYCKKCIV